MMLFSIDEKKCNRDNICVAVCPMGIIEPGSKDAVPRPAADAYDLCIRCGHCVAVCPNAALSHAVMAADSCPPIQKDRLPVPEDVEHFLRTRRSIRTYKNRTVEHDALARLIHMARYAPSGHNTQPARWLVIQDKQEVGRLAEIVIDWVAYMLAEKPRIAQSLQMDRLITAWENNIDCICRGAPHMIITHAPKADPHAHAACIIALAYLELAAPSLGLGACWAGYFNAAANSWPPMQKALKLPAGHTSFGAMMVGYPRYGYHRLPLRNAPPITWR